jgi:hypothetical protein
MTKKEGLAMVVEERIPSRLWKGTERGQIFE